MKYFEYSVTATTMKGLEKALNGRNVVAVLGDVHSAVEAAEVALNLAVELPVKIASVGDLVDRIAGPRYSSTMVVELFLRMQREHGVQIVSGNHEAMLLESFLTGRDLAAEIGGVSAFSEYRRLGGVPVEHLSFLRALPAFIEFQNVTVVHGGIEARFYERPIREIPADSLMWTYDTTSRWAGRKLIRGHQVVSVPVERPTDISLDTGVYLPDGNLTLGLISDELDIGERFLGYFSVNPRDLSVRLFWHSKLGGKHGTKCG